MTDDGRTTEQKQFYRWACVVGIAAVFIVMKKSSFMKGFDFWAFFLIGSIIVLVVMWRIVYGIPCHNCRRYNKIRFIMDHDKWNPFRSTLSEYYCGHCDKSFFIEKNPAG